MATLLTALLEEICRDLNEDEVRFCYLARLVENQSTYGFDATDCVSILAENYFSQRLPTRISDVAELPLLQVFSNVSCSDVTVVIIQWDQCLF